jgi:hypothetical protein
MYLQIVAGEWRRRSGVAVCKARAVVDVEASVNAAPKSGLVAHVQRVALIVIDRGITLRYHARRCADKSSSNGAPILGDLVGIREMHLPVAPEVRRTQRLLGAVTTAGAFSVRSSCSLPLDFCSKSMTEGVAQLHTTSAEPRHHCANWNR